MSQTALFILFPVYEDFDEVPFYVNKIGVAEPTEMKEYLDKVEEVKSVLSAEVFDGYYDSENVRAFIMHTRILEDNYPNFQNVMRKSMLEWGVDWRRNMLHNADDVCTCYGYNLCYDTFSEVAKRIVTFKSSNFAVIDNGAIKISDDIIPVKCNDVSVVINKVYANAKSVAHWMAKNRKPQRVFNLSDKHGENGKGAHPEHNGDVVSVLLCSKEEANEKLKCALGIESKSLYAYDSERGKYMKFYREAPFVYHGHHVLLPKDEAKIPQQIKDLLNTVK